MLVLQALLLRKAVLHQQASGVPNCGLAEEKTVVVASNNNKNRDNNTVMTVSNSSVTVTTEAGIILLQEVVERVSTLLLDLVEETADLPGRKRRKIARIGEELIINLAAPPTEERKRNRLIAVHLAV